VTDWQAARIESITVQTPTVKSFVFRPVSWPPFLPGQHVDVRLLAPDGYEARRSYSITSAPGGATFELAIEKLDDGEVSPFFHDVARTGDDIDVGGPFTEHFVWRPARDGATLLVGGGSGVAPFMSMVRHRDTLTDAPPMTLVYSARTAADVMFRDELYALEESQRDLQLILVLTRHAAVADRPPNYVRRIDAPMLADVIAAVPLPPQSVFVCGNNGFVGTVADALVSLGIAAARIRTERYGE
jgi:ferredoxin-NADP reductase